MDSNKHSVYGNKAIRSHCNATCQADYGLDPPCSRLWAKPEGPAGSQPIRDWGAGCSGRAGPSIANAWLCSRSNRETMVAQEMKISVAKPDNLSLMPRTHVWWTERTDIPQVVLVPTHMPAPSLSFSCHFTEWKYIQHQCPPPG